MMIPKCNISKIGLFIAGVGLLFGTNFAGGCMSQYYRTEAATEKVAEIRNRAFDNTRAISENKIDIEVIKTKLDNIEKLQERAIRLLENK